MVGKAQVERLDRKARIEKAEGSPGRFPGPCPGHGQMSCPPEGAAQVEGQAEGK